MDIQAYIQSGIIESYVLGLSNAEETAEIESLALQYPEVQQAIDHFSLMLEKQAFDNAITPPAHIREKVLLAVQENDYKPAAITSTNFEKENNSYFDSKPSTPLIVGKTKSIWKYMAAACLILLITSAAFNFYLYNQNSQQKEQYQALLLERNSLQANNQVYQTTLQEWQSASAMMADPAMIAIKLHGVPGKEGNMATVFWDSKSKDVYVMPNKLHAPVNDKQFQLWAMVDGKPVDAGIIDPACTSVCKMKNIPKAEAFAITLENTGGSQIPTMEQLYVMAKI